MVAFDTSTTGGGALIWLTEAGTCSGHVLDMVPAAYWAAAWTPSDEALIEATIGCPCPLRVQT